MILSDFDPMKLTNRQFREYIRLNKKSARLAADLIRVAKRLDLINCPISIVIKNQAQIRKEVLTGKLDFVQNIQEMEN